jgi:hypothetical protein
MGRALAWAQCGSTGGLGSDKPFLVDSMRSQFWWASSFFAVDSKRAARVAVEFTVSGGIWIPEDSHELPMTCRKLLWPDREWPPGLTYDCMRLPPRAHSEWPPCD